MIEIREIPVEESDAFFDKHIAYLLSDNIISGTDEIAYFTGDDYRGILRSHMRRAKDRHHMVYFYRDGERVGAAQYNTYKSEDGKCFILDFWIFPEFRNRGIGKECFKALEAYTALDGARYYVLNSMQENAIRFWESLGFHYIGDDEYALKVFEKRPPQGHGETSQMQE